MNRFAERLEREGLELRHTETEVLQLNLGKMCNLVCTHCHVNAGPGRKEIMTRETADRILEWLAGSGIGTVDLTGGAPEMNPSFRHLVESVRRLRPSAKIIDRCNLTILLEPGCDDLPEFLAENRVEIVASLPCYSAKNVDGQRGEHVFDASIAALQRLNRLGYGREESRPLHLVYNPNGAFLPGPQEELEADYKSALRSSFGIEFHRLYTIANMPIARFAAALRRTNGFDSYSDLLRSAFNPSTVDGLMCRNTINVGWRGEVYDCDFNQMLDLQWEDERLLYLWDIDPGRVFGRPIQTADHCFGCTAGCGSSCGGALLKS
ncbi:MAG TPA: arsenosugar biosynthesis radical SAM (seleno)protein ArsS [Candidatus Limnocylindria bacterium]|jgi:radical SAM/Cys-rich protein|nr:arsenosugar biosynthesis radical SAM (seleno)protein ArsS [Candidatus Limnocylindria bacterium]